MRSAKQQASLLLHGGTVLNVYTGEQLPWDVAVSGSRILHVGPGHPGAGPETTALDVTGRHLVPGYVDPHFHPWFIYNPVTFGEAAAARGITTLFCDNLIFYMLMGVEPFERLVEVLSHAPIAYYWSARALSQTPMEDEDDLFAPANVKRLLDHPRVRSVGEITRWRELIHGNAAIRDIVAHARSRNKRVDGHTAGAKGDDLVALAAAGVDSCHESINGDEVVSRLRLGMYAMLRESSLRQDLRALLRRIREEGLLTDRVTMTTDSSSPAFYDEHGIQDRLIRIALEEGVDPATAYRMCTLTPAVYFGMDHHIGGIAPGRQADILVLRDLSDPVPETVVAQGRIVARNGVLERPFPQPAWEQCFPPPAFVETPWRAQPEVCTIPARGDRARLPVVRLVSPVITRQEERDLPVRNGRVCLQHDGLCYAALLARTGAWVTNGLLTGFASRVEGLASSFNTATQILAIGTRPEAMALAVNRMMEMGGGIVLAEGEQIVYELPLPLGGMMSDRPLTSIAAEERTLLALLQDRGHPYHDPLYTLIFLPNDFLPTVRITWAGVVNIVTGDVLWPRRELKA